VAPPVRGMWRQIQRGACLVLGSAIVVDALAASKPLSELIVGCVVLGVLPIGDVADVVARSRGGGRREPAQARTGCGNDPGPDPPTDNADGP
jgi:hypothetical protein